MLKSKNSSPSSQSDEKSIRKDEAFLIPRLRGSPKFASWFSEWKSQLLLSSELSRFLDDSRGPLLCIRASFSTKSSDLGPIELLVRSPLSINFGRKTDWHSSSDAMRPLDFRIWSRLFPESADFLIRFLPILKATQPACRAFSSCLRWTQSLRDAQRFTAIGGPKKRFCSACSSLEDLFELAFRFLCSTLTSFFACSCLSGPKPSLSISSSTSEFTSLS